ncbi:MAG: hypothetical protein AAB225_21460, partial [Acidobacteriota bacterium]
SRRYAEDVLGRRPQVAWLVPLGIALVARLFVSFGLGLPWHSSDTHVYYQQAAAIRNGAYLNYFPPGFPLIIAAMPFPIPSAPLDCALVALNVLLSTATVAVVYFTALAASGDRLCAALASLLAAVWPNQLNYVRQILSEVPATFFLLAGILAFLFGRPFLFGLLAGCAGVIRTSLLPVCFLLAAAGLICRRRRTAIRIAAGAFLALIVSSVILKWRTGEWGLGGNVQLNMFIASKSGGANIDFSAPERDVSGLRVYLAAVGSRPWLFLKERGTALWELWGPFPGSAEGARPLRNRLLIGLRFPLLCLAVLAALRFVRSLEEAALVLPALVLTVVHVVLYATPRYTYAAEPALVVLASIWLARRGAGEG